jgi:hypothetical protein
MDNCSSYQASCGLQVFMVWSFDQVTRDIPFNRCVFVTNRLVAVLRISFCMSINKYLVTFIVEKASRSSQLCIFKSIQAILKQGVLSTSIISNIRCSRMSRTNQTSITIQPRLSPKQSYQQSTRFHQPSIPDTSSPSVSIKILNWC